MSDDSLDTDLADTTYAMLHQGERDIVTLMDHGRVVVALNRGGRLTLYLPVAATGRLEPDGVQYCDMGRLDGRFTWDTLPAEWRDLAANMAHILECRQGLREPPLHLVANPHQQLLNEANALLDALQKAGPKGQRLVPAAIARRDRRWHSVGSWGGGRAYLPRLMVR